MEGFETINELVKLAHDNAVEHEWWEEDRSFGEQIALMHSELSEALEEFRNGNGKTDVYYIDDNVKIFTPNKFKNLKPEGIPVELADCIIRIFDTCGRYGIDLENAIKIKIEYNKTRPYRHNGKKI